MLGRSSARHSCEYVQFKRREHRPARHERADHLVETFRKGSGFVFGLNHGPIVIVALCHFRFHDRQIVPHEARHNLAGP